MTATIIPLDAKRPKVRVYLVCRVCCAEGSATVVAGRRYYPCPDQVRGCDEEAAEVQYVVMAKF